MDGRSGVTYISIHTTAKVVTYNWVKIEGVDGISIHTTAKVVTFRPRSYQLLGHISIHTTAKVVTHLPFLTGGINLFQSTPPRRW